MNSAPVPNLFFARLLTSAPVLFRSRPPLQCAGTLCASAVFCFCVSAFAFGIWLFAFNSRLLSFICHSQLPHHHKSPLASRQHFSRRAPNFPATHQISPLARHFLRLHRNFLIHGHGPQIFDRQFRRHRAYVVKSVHFAHRFIEQQRDDSSVQHSVAPLIFRAKLKPPHDATRIIIPLEHELHSARIRRPAAEARIIRLRLQPLDRHSLSHLHFCCCRFPVSNLQLPAPRIIRI